MVCLLHGNQLPFHILAVVIQPRQLASDCDPYGYPPCLNGINVTSDNALWTGTGSILNQRLGPSYDSVAWESPVIGRGFGRRPELRVQFSATRGRWVSHRAGPYPYTHPES